MQVLAGPLEGRLGGEIGHIDDQRIALPAATRIPPPLPDVRRQMRPVGHGDNALPPLPLTRIVENRNGPGRLHNLQEKTSGAAKIGQDGRHTTLAQASVLWTVGARSEERRVGKECRSRWSPYH